MMADAYLHVLGTLDALGADGDEILFRPLWLPEGVQDNGDVPQSLKHYGIRFEGSTNNSIKYVSIWGSDYNGIYMVDANTFTDFDFVQCHYNDQSGLRIYGDTGGPSYTNITIADCEFNNNLYGLRCTEAPFAVVDDGSSHNNSNKGYYVYNGGGEVSDFHIFENGTDGFYTNDSWDAECTDVLIEDNTNHGMYVYDDAGDNYFFIIRDNGTTSGKNGVRSTTNADPYFGGASIHDNGTDVAESSASAEIYLSSSGNIGIANAHNDIWDEDVDQDVQGDTEYLIYHATAVNYVDGEDNYWGDEDGPEWDWFHPSGDPAQNLNLMQTSTWVDFDAIPNIADARIDRMEELFTEARELTRAGHRERAIPIYRQILENYPSHRRATTAMNKLHGCWLRTGRSLPDIIEYFEDFECPEEAENLSNELFYILAKDYMLNDDFDRAEQNLRGRIANPRTINDSLRALIELEHVLISRMEQENPQYEISGVASQIQYHEQMIELYQSMQESPCADYEERIIRMPDDFVIAEAYPNPFNSSSTITFSLKDAKELKIAIYDLQGREVALLHEGQQSAGIHTVTWKASGQASGVYICKLEAGSISKSIKLSLIQ